MHADDEISSFITEGRVRQNITLYSLPRRKLHFRSPTTSTQFIRVSEFHTQLYIIPTTLQPPHISLHKLSNPTYHSHNITTKNSKSTNFPPNTHTLPASKLSHLLPSHSCHSRNATQAPTRREPHVPLGMSQELRLQEGEISSLAANIMTEIHLMPSTDQHASSRRDLQHQAQRRQYTLLPSQAAYGP